MMLCGVPQMMRAQLQLPDPSFEDWSGEKFDGVEQPKYWHYSNVTQMGFKFNFAQKAAGRTGYCLKVNDQAMKVMGIDGGTSPGYAALGQPWAYVPGLDKIPYSTAGTYGGIAFTARPDTVALWVKTYGEKRELENFNIVFYMWTGTAKGLSYGSEAGCTEIVNIDEESDIRLALDANSCVTETPGNEVGEALHFEAKTYNDWTLIKIPVYYMNDDIPEKCNLILSAGNYPAGKSTAGMYPGNGLMVDDVELIYAATIQKLVIGGREWKGFDPNSSEVQTYSLGAGVTTIPEIVAMRGAGKETNCNGLSYTFAGRRLSDGECTISGGKVDGDPVAITVKSEDGKHSRTYHVKFVSKASDNAHLSSIEVNGEPISGFNSYLTEYSYALPYKTTQTPVVSATAQDAGAVLSITQPASVNGKAVIEVTSQDGNNHETYTVQFSVAQLSDVTLKDILVDGVSLEGFSPNKSNYTLRLPVSQTEAPVITPVSAYDEGEQTIRILQNTLSGGCQIEVSAPGAPSPRIYKITYKQEASDNKYLQSLMLDGEEISGWNPTRSAYSVLLPQGTTEAPAISYVAGDNEQKITLTENGLNAISTVQVEAGNGDKWTYSIDIRVEQSENASLKMIYLDGEPLEDFDPAVLVYKHVLDELPAPEISVDKGDEFQQVVIVQAKGYGRAQINVTAEAGNNQTYVVRFIRPDEQEPVVPDAPTDTIPLSGNAQLKMIYLDGQPLAGFDSTTYAYTVEGLTQLPVLSVETVSKVGEVRTVLGSLDAMSTIEVISRDGKQSAVYSLLLRALRDSDAAPEEIAVEEYGIDFDPAVTHYDVVLPKGADYPTVSCARRNDYQSVTTITTSDCHSREVRFIIVSGDSTVTKEYVIEMAEAQSTLPNELKSIVVEGYGTVDMTNASRTWDIELPWGADGIHVQYFKNFEEQVVLVAEGGLIRPTVLTVYSGRAGDEPATYTLRPIRSTTDPTGLKAIRVNGALLSDFRTDAFRYVVPVAARPTITWETFDDDTEVEVVEEDAKHMVISTYLHDVEHDYTLYFYYTNDVIPMDFTDWVETQFNGGRKPRGWTVPADIVANSSAGGYTTGNEIRPSKGADEGRYPDAGEGLETVHMDSPYFTNFGSYNPVPAIMTLGSMVYNLPGWGGNNARVAGGIAYRNTPDSVRIDFKPIQKQNLDHGLLEVRTRYAGGYDTTFVQNIPYGVEGQWQQLAMPLSWKTGALDTLNITINGTDRYSGFGGLAGQQQRSEVRVRNMQIGYNSSLRALHVEGQEVAVAKVMYYTLPSAELVGAPSILLTGQVEDQQPVLSWGEEVNHKRILTLRNWAEDKTTYSDYRLEVTRPVSALCDTAFVRREGHDLVAAATSAYASLRYEPIENGYRVIVTAENGTQKSFDCVDESCRKYIDTVIVALPHVQEQDTLSQDTTHYELSSNSTLEMITIAGQDYAHFSPTNYDYEIFTQETVLGYRASEEQHVYRKEIKTTLVDYHYLYCYAEDGSMSTYVVRLNHKTVSNDAALSAILINGEPLESFSPDVYFHQVELPAGTMNPSVLALTRHDEANVQVQSTSTTVGTTTVLTYIFTVTAEDTETTATYTIVLLAAPKPSSRLEMIYINNHPLDNFQSEILTGYEYKLAYGESLESVRVDKADPAQTVEIESNDQEVRVRVIATDGEQSMYVVSLRHELSDNCLLQMIYLDGAELPEFQPEDEEFDVILPYGTTDVPVVTWLAGNEDQRVGMQREGWNVTVSDTAQNGDIHNYLLRFTVELSDNVRLADLRVKGQTIAGFHADTATYTLLYPVGSTAAEFVLPADVEAITEDAHAMCEVRAVEGGDILVIVTAENGVAKGVYTIYQRIELSNDADLQAILIGGNPLPGFDPAVTDYTYLVENDGQVNRAGDFILPVAKDTTLQEVFADATITVGETFHITVVAEDNTEKVYTVLLLFGSNPNQAPNTEICRMVRVPGTRRVKFVTLYKNVHAYLYDSNGHLVFETATNYSGGIPVANPNTVDVQTNAYGQEELVNVRPDADGVESCELDPQQIYIGVFYTDVNSRKTRMGRGQKIMIGN